MKKQVFWDVTSCQLVNSYQYLKGMLHINLQESSSFLLRSD